MYDSLPIGMEPTPLMPPNEPVKAYAPGSPERAELMAEIEHMIRNPPEIALNIGGREVKTGRVKEIRAPFDHTLVLGRYHEAGAAEAAAAADAAMAAWKGWSELPFRGRAAVFRRAAALISSGWRVKLAAATILGQSKNFHQAEIDAVCETADFFRINPALAERLYAEQPRSDSGETNIVDYRPLEGFVYAVSPFNFTAIAANLAAAPALMGNVVVWKPASSSVLSNYWLMKLYEEAGLPPGVINFIPGSAREITGALLSRPDFSGLHFTGSTAVFNSLWRTAAENLAVYKSYPRIVGETGGKDFIIVLPDAEPESAVAGIVRGAFEYQGQKCSAASRLYLPRSRADELLPRLVAEIEAIRVGTPLDGSNFVNAVIDEVAFKTISGYIDRAMADPGRRILAGGGYDSSKGWFIEPTLILSDDPRSESMVEEIFGPVLTAYVYDDADLPAAYALVDSTSPYALTGGVFGRDRNELKRAVGALRHAAGNFYINDKPTGAVVGRQPFGGSRGSGTNDKAGSMLNLMRWVTPRTIKENFAPPKDWRYPFMG